jgi:hypothetical protein
LAFVRGVAQQGLVAMDTIGLDLRKRERFVDAVVSVQPAPASATTAGRQVKRVRRGASSDGLPSVPLDI